MTLALRTDTVGTMVRMSKVRNIRVDDATWEKWKVDAKYWGVSVSGLVRMRMGHAPGLAARTLDDDLCGVVNPPVAPWRPEEPVPAPTSETPKWSSMLDREPKEIPERASKHRSGCMCGLCLLERKAKK